MPSPFLTRALAGQTKAAALFAIATLTLIVLMVPHEAQAEDGRVTGYVFEADRTVFLEGDDGALYVLKGKNLLAFHDAYVSVAGTLRVTRQGEYELTVSSIGNATPPSDLFVEEQPQTAAHGVQ